MAGNDASGGIQAELLGDWAARNAKITEAEERLKQAEEEVEGALAGTRSNTIEEAQKKARLATITLHNLQHPEAPWTLPEEQPDAGGALNSRGNSGGGLLRPMVGRTQGVQVAAGRGKK